MKHKMHHKQKGFTLIEIATVIVVIAILTASGLVLYRGYQERARDSVRKSDFSQMQTALELYKKENKTYPDCNGVPFVTGSALSSCSLPDSDIESAMVPEFISALAGDPKNNTYTYTVGSVIDEEDCTTTDDSSNNYHLSVALESGDELCVGSAN